MSLDPGNRSGHDDGRGKPGAVRGGLAGRGNSLPGLPGAAAPPRARPRPDRARPGRYTADIPSTARPLRRLRPDPGVVAHRTLSTACRHCGSHRDGTGSQGCRRRPPHDRHAAGPPGLDCAPLAAPGARIARPVAVRAGRPPRVPPQPRHPGPPQALADPARLEPEHTGRRRTGLPPTRGHRPAARHQDRGRGGGR